MEQVYRCYAEKRTGFDVEAEKVWRELKEQLGIANLEGVRIICRYDVDQVDKEVYEMAKTTVFSEPMVDDFYDETMMNRCPRSPGSTPFWQWSPCPASLTSGRTPAPSASSCWLAATGLW